MNDTTPSESSASDELETVDTVSAPEIDETKSAPQDRATAGPFDVSEVPAMRPYIDLGGIKVAPREGLQLRLEVEEKTKRIVAVTLEYANSVLQVQAFSAPKTTGLWHRVRAEISQQLSNQGSTVETETGALGLELIATTPAAGDSADAARAVRFFAVDGPRWMLRGVLMGLGATDSSAREQVLEVFRDMVVVRGDQPMPPSELLPLQVPAGVNTTTPQAPTAA